MDQVRPWKLLSRSWRSDVMESESQIKVRMFYTLGHNLQKAHKTEMFRSIGQAKAACWDGWHSVRDLDGVTYTVGQ